MRIAANLRDLPREEFKARLKQDLLPSKSTGRGTIPEGFRTITPYLVVHQAAELIEFVKQVFGAEELFRTTGGAGGIHCEVKIGNSILMIGGGADYTGTPKPTGIHLYVPDADAVYQRALRAGAVSLYEPADRSYGDREGGVRDVGGNFWYIGTNKQTGLAPEGLATITGCLQSPEPRAVLEFLKIAFGAEEMLLAESPSGVFHHAKIRIGSSVLELGPAHGQFQPMPTMFYLYVEDVDAVYRHAVEAGATSISPPADQPYGDRNGGVRDPFGNEWYIATRIKNG